MPNTLDYAPRPSRRRQWRVLAVAILLAFVLAGAALVGVRAWRQHQATLQARKFRIIELELERRYLQQHNGPASTPAATQP